MKKNNKNGFTLVELLAVIVILAIILVIAVPKVMDIINDAKKGTLESTAKMIASAAEKKKMENEVFDDNTKINCKDVVKLNDVDYDRCIIEFDNVGNAKVTIKGKGKFTGLNVCVGDKTTSTATDTSCNVEYGNGATYIEKLEAFNGTSNGLTVDTTADKNIRYVGSNPSNKVYFNCKDTDSNSVAYGQTNYDYASSCEVWRIIGVFEVDNGKGDIEKRMKIVRDVFTDASSNLVKVSFDSSANNGGIDNNSGFGINQWGKSTYEDGSVYEGADLMRMLNGYYIGEESTCTYCNGDNQGTCSNDCSSSISVLSDTSLNMVENALWYTGTQRWLDTLPLSSMYDNERGVTSRKICEADSNWEGKIVCTDTVNRTTEWVGKVALIYPSDYGFASTDTNCASDIYGENSSCQNDNWLSSSVWYWTLSNCASPTSANSLWSVYPSKNMHTLLVYYAGGVRPTLYLASSVQIIGGDGNSVPYKLAM